MPEFGVLYLKPSSLENLKARDVAIAHMYCMSSPILLDMSTFQGIAIFTPDLIGEFLFFSHPVPDAAQFLSSLLAYDKIFSLSWHVVYYCRRDTKRLRFK